MSFQPSEHSYGASGASMTQTRAAHARRAEEAELRAAIRRTSARIAHERAQIRKLKARIAAEVRRNRHDPALLRNLHSFEFALHRDRHLLNVLQAHVRGLEHASAAAVRAAIAAERAAGRGDMQPERTVAGYPAPPTAPPAEKTSGQAAAEGDAEAADPAAADAHDDEVAKAAEGEDHDASVSGEVGVDTNVPLLKSPWFWGFVLVAGGAYWKRNDIKAMFAKGA